MLREQRRLDDRDGRSSSRPSEDGARHEADLRWQLEQPAASSRSVRRSALHSDSRHSPSRGDKRSPVRDRSPTRDWFHSPARDSSWFPARDGRPTRRSPSHDRRHDRSLSSAKQRLSANASPSRRYVLARSQPQFPPPKGPYQWAWSSRGQEEEAQGPPPQPCPYHPGDRGLNRDSVGWPPLLQLRPLRPLLGGLS